MPFPRCEWFLLTCRIDVSSLMLLNCACELLPREPKGAEGSRTEEPPLVFLGDPGTWALVEATLWHLSPVKLQRDTLITSKPSWEVQELHGVLGEFPRTSPGEVHRVEL